MDDPRIVIVGAGGLSTRRIYPNIGPSGGQLVGVCDLDQQKALRNANRFGGNVYSDYGEMLDSEQPDGVIVCIGPEAHAALASSIMKLGYAVYTEKPPATDAVSALEVARVANETNLLCTTAFKKRYTNAANRAKEWLSQFAEEDYYSISVDYCSGDAANTSPRSLFLLDFAIHIIDLVGYLFGDVKEIFAFSKGLDAYAVSIRFTNGAVGSMNLNDGRSSRIPTEEIEITVRGGNFMTIHNSSVWRITEASKPCEWHEPPTFTSGGDSGNDTGHLAELVDFIAALKEGRTTRSNIYESYKSMVLYEAIQKSSEIGDVVHVVYETL